MVKHVHAYVLAGLSSYYVLKRVRFYMCLLGRVAQHPVYVSTATVVRLLIGVEAGPAAIQVAEAFVPFLTSLQSMEKQRASEQRGTRSPNNLLLSSIATGAVLEERVPLVRPNSAGELYCCVHY